MQIDIISMMMMIGLGSKPTCAILLCPWERHFTALSPAWWSWQAVLNYSNISIKLLADSNIFGASVAFLRIRRINIEIKKKKMFAARSSSKSTVIVIGMVMSLGKTLYGTFPCLVVLASNSKFQLYL